MPPCELCWQWLVRRVNCWLAPAQVIALSFTLIISLMLGTFFVVLRSGAIRFNE